MLLFILLPLFLVVLCFGTKMCSDAAFYRNTYLSSCENDREKARYRRGERYKDSWMQYLLVAVGALGTLVAFIATLAVIGNVMQLKVIDQKIAVYEQENTRIEESVAAMVENYVAYESDIFTEISENISPTMVFSMYPELKSNTLVEKEIGIYADNQKELRTLELSRFDYELSKWWLYFG